MIYEFSSREALHEAWLRTPGLCGPSPGGAAGALGITRQAVHSAVKCGTLDLVRLTEMTGKGKPRVCLYIPQTSIERYRLKQGRPGPAPGWRQRLAMLGKNKCVGGVLPSDR